LTITPVADATDPLLDDYRRLNDQAFRRRYEGDDIFMTEGYVAIDRLIESGHVVRSVLLAPSRVDRFAAHAARLAATGVPVYVAEPGVIAEAVGFDLHRGVIACAERRSGRDLDDVIVGARRIAVLEGLNDAENLGAIARSARAFGLDALVVDPTCTDAYSRRTVRVSMGEILMLPVARLDRSSWIDVVERLRRAGFETWAMTPAPSAVSIWDAPVPDRVAVCLGAEGPGLGAHLMSSCDRMVRIPIEPQVDSLNVAQAAAVTFAALTRHEPGEA
jgi:tRNA G18 (ribose-2'-O)-methylase SpoU